MQQQVATMMRTIDQSCRMTVANSEIVEKGLEIIYSTINQESQNFFLDAAVGGGDGAKDCGDFFMVEKE
eukprot:6522606-Ditylum_brightwellii.AAC.1